jgi:mediator of RNA polymerase II transcription subunit 14
MEFLTVDDCNTRLGTNAVFSPHVNPHIGLASWAARVLAGKNLSRNVHILVYCLRTSIPVLLELQSICAADGTACWFPKGLVWWRALFRNSRSVLKWQVGTTINLARRFGLDFRIRPDFMLEVFDIGSQGLLAPQTETSSIHPIPNMNQICRLVSVSHDSLPLVPFDSGLLIPCFRNPLASGQAIRTLLTLVSDSLKH